MSCFMAVSFLKKYFSNVSKLSIFCWSTSDVQCWWQLQVYSKVILSHTYMHLFFFKFFSHLGCYIILSRVPSAIH